MPVPFDIVDSIFCDDARVERNGKHILIGVYLSHLIVADFPTGIPLTLWLHVTPHETGELAADLRIVKDDAVLLRGQLNTRVREIAPTVISATFPLEFQSEGKVSFQWKYGENDEWQIIKEIEVKKREN